ncbi:hypothetical protein ACFPTR_01040 [Aliibacillus thermotolerans]|uniref:Uncharacterized protein n=1 Tax=Aliibacillus thermotolerans TaxID=1834418 RepID=A0ABW0U3Y2_9BACI|nr:hypothetical protein [Aliibacillus thermotolerans]MDA3128810.1 hypothetical protein [Aliibacillus thermotolerans]
MVWKNALKVLTGMWFILLMTQIVVSFGTYIAPIPDYLLIIMLGLFSLTILYEFRKGILRELKQDSSEQ